MAEVKTKDKDKNKVKNYANDYKTYWPTDASENTKGSAPDRPEFRIFISHQKMGTETSGVPYSSQNTSNNNEDTKDNAEETSKGKS